MLQKDIIEGLTLMTSRCCGLSDCCRRADTRTRFSRVPLNVPVTSAAMDR